MLLKLNIPINGRYTPIKFIGDGGFAEVYQTTHWLLNTYPCALKILKPSNDPQDQIAFINEAKKMWALSSHPHILSIHDLDFVKITGMLNLPNPVNLPYFVSDFARNGSLADLLNKKGTLTPKEVVKYIKQIADALHYAHQNGVVHRDIKPENILINDMFDALVADFGIAADAHHTKSAIFQGAIGSIKYMSPELLKGKPVINSDQYSLSLVAAELLTGDAQIPISHGILSPAVTVEVNIVLQKAKHRNSSLRYNDIVTFASEFEKALLGQSLIVLSGSSNLPDATFTQYGQIAAPHNRNPDLISMISFLKKFGNRIDITNQANNWNSVSLPGLTMLRAWRGAIPFQDRTTVQSIFDKMNAGRSYGTFGQDLIQCFLSDDDLFEFAVSQAPWRFFAFDGGIQNYDQANLLSFIAFLNEAKQINR